MAIEEGLPYDDRTHERRPIPDPTVLTNQLVFREIGAVRDIIETKIRGLTAIVDILQREVESRPAAIDKAVNGLRVVLDERFKSISTQFEERDLRAANQQRDSKLAVDAALQAAKEAVSEQNKANSLSISKSEAAFSKQIDQIGILINTSVDSLKSNLDDVKSRLTLLEGTGKGSKDLMAVIFTVVGIGVAIVAAIIAFQKIT